MKALTKQLALHIDVSSPSALRDLVDELLRGVVFTNGMQAFTGEALDRACELVLSKPSAAEGEQSTEDKPCKEILVDRAMQAVTILAPNWIAMQHHSSVPAMSDYQEQKWLPQALAQLVGQVLWRHRKSDALQGEHRPVAESSKWVEDSAVAVDVDEESVVEKCRTVHTILSGGKKSSLKVAQWRKVMELISTNSEFRSHVRRIDPSKLYYGECDGAGLSQKQFMLLLMKIADIMGIAHPVLIFKEVASHAETLQNQQ